MKEQVFTKNHICYSKHIKKSLFPKCIRRTSEPIRDLVTFPKCLRRTRLPIRDLVDSRGRKSLQLFRDFEKVSFPRFGKIEFQNFEKSKKVFPQKCRVILPTSFLYYSPLTFLYLFQFCFHSFFGAESKRESKSKSK